MIYKKHNIAGSVILYNSEIQVVANINSYLAQINHLFVIDNSEVINNRLAEQIKMAPNITYTFNGANLGVAHALNQAATMAIKAGYQFLLTMDDDTYFPEIGVQKMLNYVNQYGTKKLGILAAQSDPQLFNNTTKQVPYAITSGSLLNLLAYKESGPFMNDLFIDFVDHEYCFRLEKCGYKIVEINYVQLNHQLGKKKQLVFFGYKFPIYWTSHNPLRIYYKTRNCIFSLKKHSFVQISVKYIFYKDVLKDLLKIIFLEDRKRKRILLFIKGLHDGLTDSLGKRNFEL